MPDSSDRTVKSAGRENYIAADIESFDPSLAPARSGYRRRRRGGGSRGPTIARYAAPIVLLAAVLITVSIAADSHMFGGKTGKSLSVVKSKSTKSNKPTPAVSATAASSATPTSSATATSTERFYTVKSGDTLSGIVAETGVSLAEIQTLNPGIDSNTLSVGQKVKLSP